MNVYTIAADQPFLDRLAVGLAERYGGDPLSLAAITVLLPTRRACRGLHEAFLRRCGGQPILLPRLCAIGDLDADELDLTLGGDGAENLAIAPAIPEMRRRLLLTQMILAWSQSTGQGAMLPAQAAVLARDLARLLDQVQNERLGFDALDRIVPGDLAHHWQITAKFLEIVTQQWPSILAVHDALDPAERRNRLLAAQLAAWRKHPPAQPVIAAGFTAASPAASDLLTFLAYDPKGAVVLPGVDIDADETLWAAITEDPAHPQHGLSQILRAIGVGHDTVKPWQNTVTHAQRSARVRLVTEIMRPAAISDAWTTLDGLLPSCLDGIARYDCPGPQEEAGVIAVLLRAQLEIQGATAILVTPDRALARRVASELARWDIEIDDSAGIPLNLAPPGVFLRLVAQAIAEDLAPVPLLALLKHPLAGLGHETARLRDLVRRFERYCLRGPRPAPGLVGLTTLATILRSKAPDIAEMLDRISLILAPFVDLLTRPSTTLAEIFTAHLRAAEALAATADKGGAERLWDAEAGAALADFATDLLDAATGFKAISGADYPALLETLLSGSVVRPRFGNHPRLRILGALEARLQHADLIILGGLNEGVWPTDPGQDPWMSRPMRARFGLPPADAQIGLSAHDFAASLMAPNVVLTRALRVDGAPSVPSRWLLRFETVLTAAGLTLETNGPALSWQAALDATEATTPMPPPAPKPPRSARPTRLSVTEIETWRRDPYAIYAKHILKLRALDPIDQDPGAADRGSFIHAALDAYLRITPRPDRETAYQCLLECGRVAFGDALTQPGIWAFWWPRFERIAAWFLDWDEARAGDISMSLTERQGQIPLSPGGVPFELRARVDRIDRRADGRLAIIDYKTGGIPSTQDILHGFAPQLPLEAAIAQAGGFVGVPASDVADLLYLKLSGGEPAGEEYRAGGKKAEPAALAADALDGLESLIVKFSDEATPYLAQPRPDKAPRYGDYHHLARFDEWGGGSGD